MSTALAQKSRLELSLLEMPHLQRVVILRCTDENRLICDEAQMSDVSTGVRTAHLRENLASVQVPQHDGADVVEAGRRHQTLTQARVCEERDGAYSAFLVGKSEQDFIVKQVDEVNLAVLATNCDYIYDRALHDRLDGTRGGELVDLLILNHVPQLHLRSTIEEHLVDVGHRMDDASQFVVVQLSSFDHFAGLGAESEEFTLFRQRENQVRSHNEL